MIQSLPGKLFWTGEYSVLWGGDAVVQAIEPRFIWRKKKENEVFQSYFSQFFQNKNHDFFMESPFGQAGGFGGSSAEFLFLANQFGFAPKQDLKKIWQMYRSSQNSEFLPSGADLVVQVLGGCLEFRIEEDYFYTNKIEKNNAHENVFLFSASHQLGRKVRTHEDLSKLKEISPIQKTELNAIVRSCRDSLKELEKKKFFHSLSDYGNMLSSFGLEIAQTTEDKKAFHDLSSEVFVKGIGAGQADALWVAFEDQELKEPILRLAQERSLLFIPWKPAQNGWVSE